jgi:prohibitin 1
MIVPLALLESKPLMEAPMQIPILSTSLAQISRWSRSALLLSLIFTSGCATVVRQDQVGVREFLGEFAKTPSQPGLKFYFWPLGDIQKFPVMTKNMEVSLDLPSKEGLNVSAEISILYRIEPENAIRILQSAGVNYERDLILPVFRSSSADVSARFDAKDMHTGKRAEIEKSVRDKMSETLANRGFQIEAVLLKSIRLPSGLARSIEEKLQAEQNAQRMNFVLEQERKEAERLVIQAEGVKNSQRTISQGLNKNILQYQAIEAFRELSKSPNTKIVISNGSNPLIMNMDESSKR